MVCVVIAALWGTSSHYGVSWLSADQSSWALYMARSEFLVCWDATNVMVMPGWNTIRIDPPVFFGQFRLHPRKVAFTAPLWTLLALAAIPTALLWHRDRRTVKPGCCQTCGYDLRASKKVCPECGTAIAGPKR